MRNVWKGLAIGAFTGAGVGVVVDGLERIQQQARAAAARARGHTGEMLDAVKDRAPELIEAGRERAEDLLSGPT